MRRRLQLANIHVLGNSGGLPSDGLPPESTSFEFPLYLNVVDLDYEDEYGLEYVREGDDVSMSFYNWIGNQYRDNDDIYLGDNEIYINGSRVTRIYDAISEYSITLNDQIFDELYMYNDGSFYGYISKV